MYKGLPAQDKNIHLNALQCFLHVPHALHIDNLFVFQTIIYIIDLWRHCVYGIFVSTTLVGQQKKISNINALYNYSIAGVRLHLFLGSFKFSMLQNILVKYLIKATEAGASKKFFIHLIIN